LTDVGHARCRRPRRTSSQGVLQPGALGAFGANHHLRQSLVFLNVFAMQQPEAYVGNAKNLFDEQGRLTNDDTRKFLGTFAERFAAWIEVFKRA